MQSLDYFSENYARSPPILPFSSFLTFSSPLSGGKRLLRLIWSVYSKESNKMLVICLCDFDYAITGLINSHCYSGNFGKARISEVIFLV